MNWVSAIFCTVVFGAGCAFAQGVMGPRPRVPINGGVRGSVVVNGGLRRPGMGRGHHRVFTNVHPGPDSLHRPWTGSDTYDKNLGRSKDNGRSDFQRDRDATLDTLHHEEDRARAISHDEAARAEKQQTVRENKAVIEANRRAAEAERKAREAERSAELRVRAAELEAERRAAVRNAAAAERHDRILASLKPCRAYNDNGSPCTRKSNPGSEFCYLHVGYKGKLQESTEVCAPAQNMPETSVIGKDAVVPAEPDSATDALPAEAPSPVVASVSSAVPVAVHATDEPSSGHDVSTTGHLLVILTVSLISILGIGVLGGLALGFYAIHRRRE